jgi:hypothetical protein
MPTYTKRRWIGTFLIFVLLVALMATAAGVPVSIVGGTALLSGAIWCFILHS